MVDVQPGLGRETEGRIGPKSGIRYSRTEPDQSELRAPNGRLAVLSGEYWIGMLCDEGRSRGPKIYAGFRVEVQGDGKLKTLKVTKCCEYDRKSNEYSQIRHHFYGRDVSPTPWTIYEVAGIVEGRTCQLFTL